MIEVRIESEGRYLIWKRETGGKWFFHLGDHWEEVTDPAHVHSLEVGFRYGLEFLKSQISDLDINFP